MKNDKIQELVRVTERIWYYPYEKERDRPILGYIKGDHYSVAVDAGHSETHTKEFYEALHNKGLPYPKFTILTHWHWDHTFGMPMSVKMKKSLSCVLSGIKALCPSPKE